VIVACQLHSGKRLAWQAKAAQPGVPGQLRVAAWPVRRSRG